MRSWKKHSVLVTGGAGFIGSHLVRKLLDLGVKKVIVIDSLEYGIEENLPKDSRVSLIKHNIGVDPIAALEKPIKKCAFFFHLAAQKHNQSLSNLHAVYQTNIVGAADLFELAGKCGIKKIIFSSSLYSYGRTSMPPMKENDCVNPNTIYGISKVAGEHILAYYANKYKYDYAALRFFFVYGPRQFPGMGYKSVIVKNFERLAQGKRPIIFGDGNQSLDYVYVDDVINALIKVAESQINREIFNVGSGKATSVSSLTALMKKIAGSTADIDYGPADKTQGTVRVSDIKKIKKVLQWRPTITLEDGLKKTFEWIKENKHAQKNNSFRHHTLL